MAAVLAGLGSGAALAVGGAFVQADRIRVGGVVVPYGVAIAVVLVLLWQLWLGRWFGQRLATVSVAVGWVVTSVGMGTGRYGNGVVLAAESRVTWYLGLGAVAVALGASLPILRDGSAPPAAAVTD